MLTTVDLGRAPEVPDMSAYSVQLGATLHTGASALECIRRAVSAPSTPVALDIEAAGLGARAFTIRCVTAAWEDADGTQAVLLDPRRADTHGPLMDLMNWASSIVLHNSPYDWPVLYQHGLVGMEHTAKVWDTLVAARMAVPDPHVRKDLTTLAHTYLGIKDDMVTMATAFKAAGFATQEAGYQTMDIGAPVYRMGAMADTVLTLRLAPVLAQAVHDHLASNPFAPHPAVPDTTRIWELLEREQVTNRVMLRRSARGLAVDKDYLATYRETHFQEIEDAGAELQQAGLDPAAGNLGAKLVDYLNSRGELPSDWPTTDKGALKADKKAMERLADHPLVVAQQRVQELTKVQRYLDKVADYAAVTGRVHPQVGILGASATGRMSYREPELQQFPGPARAILVPDTPGEGTGWVSIDWSSIEPVVVANCAGDQEFLKDFNLDPTVDLYAPIVASAGVTRKVAKVVLLAAMYGQGQTLLAANLGTTPQEAAAIQAKVFAAMPRTQAFLNGLRMEGERRGLTMTADGRLLTVPKDPSGRYMGYKATNYFTQGTAYSVLSETINAVEREGLGDCIQLAMHDELVVSAGAAERIRQLMETPPAWLNTFAGVPVVLRTDANPLPFHWDYV